ncbi:cysteine--tRNA ligase, cytoplasmic [Apis mellifera caucasica]|uniref:Cysteine--tRNA ligase, cytoplasmic n=1 Tax=Apis mellifera TaxID=7460 RepID=A0A7M7R6Y6_APIME|nr:cysteine--tRNA ligase, cytoplasmic [Apis mellifera]KAG6796989.1 cysteine--tRNA ligase, cytoplasmic [Apis mellifera caucasica]KAG9436691.1 cysteine--tRNA ligase, cytoplasmic [Apis mellifera carnica]|eukprot:XP_394641.3 cysteine--tRNA ligase, cytoplasmic [Apis mellifera]
MAKRIQPSWVPPQRKNSSVLKLYNSLTRNKEIFVPQFGNHILWYSCGPTVYDASHMGHARSYMSFDIIRRVLSDYFGYDILYVMNITDIDDKIIKRARQNYLYEKYIKENHTLDKILDDAKNVMYIFEDTVKSTTDTDKKYILQNILCNVEKAIENLEDAVKLKDEDKMKEFQELLLKEVRDPLAEWLDKEKGAMVTEHSIFTKLSQYWEQEFHKDMDSLNVLRPNVLTRVSEYIPEIIEFIKKIIENGIAYESNGSVYFDVSTFNKQDKHYYAKLVPEAYGDTLSLQEGEGDLSTLEISEKRSPIDFALWKCSKEGEPWWESPWGKGRPGWHIECSVMASIICGESLDIHTGGVDLKFPHHDNEIAQAEAYFNNSNWVRYFLHSGHLTISGCKMSKSLKNFITIQDALKKYSARQLRLAFLLHSWKDTLDYSDNTMHMAIQYEKFLNEFFLNVKCKIRSLGSETNINTFIKWTNFEIELNEKFYNARDFVHNALCDNIDTRSALDAIRDLVTHCNIYMKEIKQPNTLLLRDVAVYITKMFTIFGTISYSHDAIGFPIDSNIVKLNVEQAVMPYLEILANFREKVRNHAKTLKASTILEECDTLRDDILPNIGVRLEDSNNEICKIKLVNREDLLKEKESKKQMELEKMLEKEKKKAEIAAAAVMKEAQRKIPPSEIFKLERDKYSRFDSNGLPTHDINGKEISKGQIKKLQKLQQAQEKRYNEYLASI